MLFLCSLFVLQAKALTNSNMSELEQLRQEAEQLRNQIRVRLMCWESARRLQALLILQRAPFYVFVSSCGRCLTGRQESMWGFDPDAGMSMDRVHLQGRVMDAMAA